MLSAGKRGFSVAHQGAAQLVGTAKLSKVRRNSVGIALHGLLLGRQGFYSRLGSGRRSLFSLYDVDFNTSFALVNLFIKSVSIRHCKY
jgi:hypothetical protein